MMLAADADKAVGGVFVLAGPEVVTTRQMAETVARQVGMPLRRFRVPVGPVLLLARLVETVAGRAGIRPPLHPRRIDFFVKSFVFALQRSSDVLGFVPRVGFERGVAATLAWYRDRGHLEPARRRAGASTERGDG
jgi:nucleoside-diphosphate-sugar epimerase